MSRILQGDFLLPGCPFMFLFQFVLRQKSRLKVLFSSFNITVHFYTPLSKRMAKIISRFNTDFFNWSWILGMPKFIPDMLLLLVKIFQIIMCVQLLRVAGFNMTITGGRSIRTFKYLFVSLRTSTQTMLYSKFCICTTIKNLFGKTLTSNVKRQGHYAEK